MFLDLQKLWVHRWVYVLELKIIRGSTDPLDPPDWAPLDCGTPQLFNLVEALYRGSSHSAVLPQRGFPSYTDVLVLVRGGVRTFYLINSSNTVFLSRLKNQCYRRTPCSS